MFDNHVHTNFSVDSDMDALDACNTAIKIGLEGIAFTDHLDYDFPGFDDSTLIDFDKYSKFMDSLKTIYKGRLKVLKGIEVGYQPHITHKNETLLKKYNFDFIINSIHIIDKLDPYIGEYYINKTKEEAYYKYLQEIKRSICEFDNYDIVGHIGYVIRYGHYDDNTLYYSEFKDIFDEILNIIIANGKGIEINTSGYFSNVGVPMANYDLISRYFELGGEIITVGSDAHHVERIGAKFEDAYERLKEIGFKYVSYFEARKPVFIKL